MPSIRSFALTAAAAGVFALAASGPARACPFSSTVPVHVLDPGQTCILDYAIGGHSLYNGGAIDLRNGGRLAFVVVDNKGSLINNNDAGELFVTVNKVTPQHTTSRDTY